MSLLNIGTPSDHVAPGFYTETLPDGTERRIARHPTHSHAYTLAKTISYRLLATIETTIIAWLLTWDLTVTISFTAIEALARVVTYYWHERLWVWINRRIWK